MGAVYFIWKTPGTVNLGLCKKTVTHKYKTPYGTFGQKGGNRKITESIKSYLPF